jgi:hypothetical protein
MPTLSDDPKERAAEDKCLADIAEHGLHVLRVFGDDEWPGFVYSVGLYHNFQIPEIIIVGLKPDLSHVLLNEIAKRARQGERFQLGDTIHGLLDDFSLMLRPVRDELIEPHFGWDLWYYKDQVFPTAQLVWPTTSGIWPWDPRASEEFRARQPVLANVEVPPWARRAS